MLYITLPAPENLSTFLIFLRQKTVTTCVEASSLTLKMLQKFPSEVQEYFYKLDKWLKKHRITLKLSSGLSVNNNGRCSGYFDSFNKELAVALGKGWEHSFQISVHEESHVKQYLDESSVWHSEISENHSNFFYWLEGQNFSNPQALAESAMILERDAERRALAIMRKKYSHLIDPEKYALRSNCYLASYFWMLKHRKWLKKSPYDRRLMAHCPPKLFRNFADIPGNLIAAMDKFL